jgi:hypothetical protein
VKSVYRIWDCLAFKHLLTKKGSIEELANGHRFVNEHRGETITFGNEKVPKYPYVTEQLDAMINHARRANDARFLLKYARAVRMVADNKPAKWDLTTQAMVAWWRLHESLGQNSHAERSKGSGPQRVLPTRSPSGTGCASCGNWPSYSIRRLTATPAPSVAGCD